jgi:GntR family transcriptional regulator of vanillate catabolism
VAFEYRDVRRRHDDHHRIFEAITAREPWRAEMLMREHVSSIKTSLIRSLSERNADHRGEMHPADESIT